MGEVVTDEMVEQAAEAFIRVRGIGMHQPWQSMTEESRADYRSAFRAALKAALASRHAIDLSKLRRCTHISAGFFQHDAGGEWVKYSDVAALIAGETK